MPEEQVIKGLERCIKIGKKSLEFIEAIEPHLDPEDGLTDRAALMLIAIQGLSEKEQLTLLKLAQFVYSLQKVTEHLKPKEV